MKIANEVHHFDLLYIPSDMLYENKYKYILSGIDVASRYKVARPMRMKQAAGVAEMIADVYKVGALSVITEASSKLRYLTCYRSMECDIQCTMTKYKQMHEQATH